MFGWFSLYNIVAQNIMYSQLKNSFIIQFTIQTSTLILHYELYSIKLQPILRFLNFL